MAMCKSCMKLFTPEPWPGINFRLGKVSWQVMGTLDSGNLKWLCHMRIALILYLNQSLKIATFFSFSFLLNICVITNGYTERQGKINHFHGEKNEIYEIEN